MLTFPAVDEPVVTIVMVTHGARSIVGGSLAALLSHTPPAYRLVIVDSASPDDTATWLAESVRGATLVLSDRNVGYGAGSNLGAERAATRSLLFMNPDVFPRPGWLPPLLAALDHAGTAAAGPRLLHPDGRLQAAGSLVDRTGATRRHGDGDRDPLASAYRFARQPDYLSGACLLVERRAFHAAGGFDPAYGLGYFEDVDLCFTLAAAGHRIAYVPASAVIHVRDASGGSRSLADTVVANHRFFESRWRATLRARPSPALFDRPEGSLLARDARASGRILVTGAAVDDVPMMLAMDPRLLVTVVGREAADLEPLVEVVPHAEDWSRWFAHRRHHYDLIVGHDDRLERSIEDTQPLAQRLARATVEALAANGCVRWPAVV